MSLFSCAFLCEHLPIQIFADWEIVEDVFSLGYHIGMAFHQSEHLSCNGQFTDINFDDVDIGINLNLANAGSGSSHIGI
jgi:hypothetical protein